MKRVQQFRQKKDSLPVWKKNVKEGRLEALEKKWFPSLGHV